MKKEYMKPTMDVVQMGQMGQLLAGSLDSVDGNAGVGYGGAGTGDPQAPDLVFDWDDLYAD